MKQGVWSKDWVAALAFSGAFVLSAYAVFPGPFEALERFSYDLGVRASPRVASDRIVVVAIDEQSIDRIGPYPWPRSVHAQLLDRVRASGATAVASTIYFPESRDEPGLAALTELSTYLAQSPLTQSVPDEIEALGKHVSRIQALAAAGRPASPSDPLPADVSAMRDLSKSWAESTLATQYTAQMMDLRSRIDAARDRLSSQDPLNVAMRDLGAFLLPMMLRPDRSRTGSDSPMPDYVRRFALTNLRGDVDERPEPMLSVERLPRPDLGRVAAGIGHLMFTPDQDGVVRKQALVVQYDGAMYPSLSLATAATALHQPSRAIEVRTGQGVRLGGILFQTTPGLKLRSHFYGDVDGRPPFSVHSFHAVRNGALAAGTLKDKIVLIGLTAPGTTERYTTPVSSDVPPVLMLAHSLSSLLKGHYIVRPAWSGFVTAGLIVLAVVYLALVLPLLPSALGPAITAGLALVLLLSEFWLMAASAVSVQFTAPAMLLIAGHLFAAFVRTRPLDKLKLPGEAERAESNRLLGLAYQGQGQLDMAFEKFRLVQPADDKLLDQLYSLAIEFERRRQFDKAERVYEYIESEHRYFRDVQSKRLRARKLAESAGSGTGAASAPGSWLDVGLDGMEKPMLGRYQVEKELGKGAMGVVYLGRDPKIGRKVAIKTMALSGDFAADDIEAVKESFFREAEAAGRLSHPHIVQVFDVGEEHDLAYIAMEFIEGHDLMRHTTVPHLLPVKDVIKYIADAADALDYAHSRNIVHRDIKPANLMLIEQTKTIKVTDFGVARVDTSRSKAGMVLGTPSYMSPEQLAGRKVDGRSDLFSLGVTLYQLLTGSLPFQADSMSALMYKIANDKQEPVASKRPGLPSGLDAIIDKVLEKHVDRRYARGADFARDLRAEMLQFA